MTGRKDGQNHDHEDYVYTSFVIVIQLTLRRITVTTILHFFSYIES